MKPFAPGLALIGLLIFIQAASAATPAPSPATSVSGSPSPSLSGTPRPTSDPAEERSLCAFTMEGVNGFSCIPATENLINCPVSLACKGIEAAFLGKAKCLPDKKTEEECAGSTTAPSLSKSSSAPFVQPKDLGELAEGLYRWSLRIIGLAVLIVFFIGLFMNLTAAGFPAQVGQSKSLMLNAVYGAALLLAAYVILNTINPDFVKQSGTLPALKSPELIGSPAPTATLPAN